MTEQSETTSSLAEQIKARVRKADQERITKRADAAAAVAAKLQEREQLQAQLTALESELQTLVTDTTVELMTEKELAEFVGVKPTDLGARRTKRAPRKRRATTPE